MEALELSLLSAITILIKIRQGHWGKDALLGESYLAQIHCILFQCNDSSWRT